MAQEQVIAKKIIDGTGGILWLLKKDDQFYVTIDNPRTHYASGVLLVTHTEGEARRIFDHTLQACRDDIQPDAATLSLDEAERVPYQMKELFKLNAKPYE